MTRVAHTDGPRHAWRYADADAAEVHIAGLWELSPSGFPRAVDPTGFFVCGDAGDAVRGALGPMGAQFMGAFGGFSR